MAPIVAPAMARFTVNQSIGGQPVANVLDFEVNSLDPLVDRDETLFRVAGDILNNWNDHILANQVDNLTALSVSWLDLDSLTGSRGERSTTDDNTWPAQGANTTSSAMPGVVAMRVDKATFGRRGNKNGRMYLSGVSEGWTGPEVTMSWESSTVDDINSALSDFLDGVNGVEGVETRSQTMGVIHTQNGAYAGSTEVSALTVNPNISTQVRRGTLR